MKDIVYWLKAIHAALLDKKAPVSVTDMKSLTAEQLEGLDAGDIVIKHDNTGKHSYVVSYKGSGGLCLTYTDCENVETVAYEKSGSTWSWDSTDVTHIAS